MWRRAEPRCREYRNGQSLMKRALTSAPTSTVTKARNIAQSASLTNQENPLLQSQKDQLTLQAKLGNGSSKTDSQNFKKEGSVPPRRAHFKLSSNSASLSNSPNLDPLNFGKSKLDDSVNPEASAKVEKLEEDQNNLSSSNNDALKLSALFTSPRPLTTPKAWIPLPAKPDMNTSEKQNVQKLEEFEGYSKFQKVASAPSNALQTKKFVVNMKNVLEVITPEPKIMPPRLHHGLDRVLFTKGVCKTRNAFTGQYYFDPFVSRVVDNGELVTNIFVPPSKDKTLQHLAEKHNKLFTASTSSIGGSLSTISIVVGNFRSVQTQHLSYPYRNMSAKLTRASRFPQQIRLTRSNGTYAIDADNEDPQNILSALGITMEKMFTANKKYFENLIKAQLTDGQKAESFAYATTGDFLLRSQLDCYDDRLPLKVFDIKTRATYPVRLDVQNYKDHINYKITSDLGLFNSYEREYYDMMRSAFLKYSFQVRIGGMDGILVAFHNTQEIFGFQYIRSQEIDERLFGSVAVANGNFHICTKLLNEILNTVIKKHPNKDLRILMQPWLAPVSLFIHVVEITDEERDDAKGMKLRSSEDRVLSLFRLRTNSYENGVFCKSFVGNENDIWDLEYTLEDVTDSFEKDTLLQQMEITASRGRGTGGSKKFIAPRQAIYSRVEADPSAHFPSTAIPLPLLKRTQSNS